MGKGIVGLGGKTLVDIGREAKAYAHPVVGNLVAVGLLALGNRVAYRLAVDSAVGVCGRPAVEIVKFVVSGIELIGILCVGACVHQLGVELEPVLELAAGAERNRVAVFSIVVHAHHATVAHISEPHIVGGVARSAVDGYVMLLHEGVFLHHQVVGVVTAVELQGAVELLVVAAVYQLGRELVASVDALPLLHTVDGIPVPVHTYVVDYRRYALGALHTEQREGGTLGADSEFGLDSGRLPREVVGVADGEFLAFLRFLGSDEDNAECAAHTIDRSRGGVFQHGYALDVVGVDKAEVVYLHVVNENQRFRRALYRAESRTDLHARLGAGLAVRGSHRQAGDRTLQGSRNIGNGTSVELLVDIDCRHRAGKVDTLLRAVAHGHNFAEHIGVGLKMEHEVLAGACAHSGRLHAHIRYLEFRLRREIAVEHEFAVDIGGNAARHPVDADAGTDGGLALIVKHRTCDGTNSRAVITFIFSIATVFGKHHARTFDSVVYAARLKQAVEHCGQQFIVGLYAYFLFGINIVIYHEEITCLFLDLT